MYVDVERHAPAWGPFLRQHPYILRGIRRTWTATIFVAAFVAAAGLMTKPALAEFEIQESQVEKGEIELEYRGAVHWGFDKQTEAEGALQEEEEAPLRQSHDFEVPSHR